MGELIDWEAVARQDGDCKHIRGFAIKDKLKEAKYEEGKEVMLKVLTGRELKVEYLQKFGFTNPILVQRRDELGLKVPHRDLTVDGIRSAVGSRRMVEVVVGGGQARYGLQTYQRISNKRQTEGCQV